ncbi:MAG: hypothetical protein Q7T71_02740 [Herbiconiux sp.]|nr:hypothetical protein [Herbiconiux sp.]
MGVRAMFAAAAGAYTANCALGLAVATRLVDTSRFRWVHHALYIATCVLTAAAVLSAMIPRRDPAAATVAERSFAPSLARALTLERGAESTVDPAQTGRRAALALLPAAVPLTLIPRIRTHSRAHPLVALTAAPFFVAAFILSRRS